MYDTQARKLTLHFPSRITHWLTHLKALITHRLTTYGVRMDGMPDTYIILLWRSIFSTLHFFQCAAVVRRGSFSKNWKKLLEVFYRSQILRSRNEVSRYRSGISLSENFLVCFLSLFRKNDVGESWKENINNLRANIVLVGTKEALQTSYVLNLVRFLCGSLKNDVGVNQDTSILCIWCWTNKIFEASSLRFSYSPPYGRWIWKPQTTGQNLISSTPDA